MLDAIRLTGVVKMCIWPAYRGLTFRDPRTGELQGIDIDLSATLASRLGVKVAYVESSLDKVIDQLEALQCDVAMQGVGITPVQQQRLRLTEPYLRSSLYGVTTRTRLLMHRWENIDQPGVKVAVFAGTVMVGAMESSLKHAKLTVVSAASGSAEDELEAGRVDVLIVDYPYARRLLDHAEWTKLVSPPQPFVPVVYAYVLRPGDDEWFHWINDFVARIKQDGSLDKTIDKNSLTLAVARE
ncbi:substrate-binding periplasmic protein [Variovorax ginsengisoli]|uniref:ABC-type amino acid transport substrate-binding protein n=1 Tax=Variovorax ginsengisoli TaxID=363844 RepID=A0ABT9SET7_9BURK|nr:ABC transporter substrate-binding protein [Variovorax ginsengisoli]MDP9902266.1 ABC-type amino acid transport substrate-binding protein [Variovorax ginsengisoli]